MFDVTLDYYHGYVHLYFHLGRNRTKHHPRMVVQMGHWMNHDDANDDVGEVHLVDMLVVDAYAAVAGDVCKDAYVYMVDIEWGLLLHRRLPNQHFSFVNETDVISCDDSNEDIH